MNDKWKSIIKYTKNNQKSPKGTEEKAANRWYSVWATKNNKCTYIWVNASGKNNVREVASSKGWTVDSYGGAIIRQNCEPIETDRIVA